MILGIETAYCNCPGSSPDTILTSVQSNTSGRVNRVYWIQTLAFIQTQKYTTSNNKVFSNKNKTQTLTHIHEYKHTQIHMNKSTYSDKHTYRHIDIHTLTHKPTHIQAIISTCTYTHTGNCTYTSTHKCTWTHTYTKPNPSEPGSMKIEKPGEIFVQNLRCF